MVATLNGQAGRAFGAGGPRERRQLLAVYVGLFGFTFVVWAWALFEFYSRPALIGAALTAYGLGLRHAVDIDHIAAIDSIVRKLMTENRRPLTVGLYFSLGHSTLVLVTTAIVALGAVTLQDRLSEFRDIGSVVGSISSAAFLLILAGMNFQILRSLWTAFLQRRHRGAGEADENVGLASLGMFTRMFRPLLQTVSKGWHIYLVGVLFALSFDTATEIGVIGLSAAQASTGLALHLILVFPALFAAGMVMADTTDSAVMVGVYGWGLAKPVAKIWYNVGVTALSMAIAATVGGVELVSLLDPRHETTGTFFWASIEAVRDNSAVLGSSVIAVFLIGWVSSAFIVGCRTMFAAPDRVQKQNQA